MSAADLGYDDIAVGMEASFDRRITEADVRTFAELSGDTNPLHMDEGYAGGTAFGGRIVHGMLTSALLSRLVGMHLPGKHALYVSQTLDFVRPVRPGDTVRVSGTVLSKQDATKALELRTEISLPDGAAVVRGRAIVRVLR